MGILNMMIVIPMFIQTITFGAILKNFLDNDPRKAILFAGVLLLIAAAATMLLKPRKGSVAAQSQDRPTIPVGGVDTPLPPG
jgi:maltose/moltooligosaccharide transporter